MTNTKPKHGKSKIELREPAKPLIEPAMRPPLRADHPMAQIVKNVQSQPYPAQPDPTQPNPTLPSLAQPNPTLPNPATSVAPTHDFNKRANSLERVALPSGLFPGTSKKLYDALYLRTRGAIIPVRTLQATRRQLMEWSGIRSKNTIAVNLQILTSVGLLTKQIEIGDQGGSIYEVRLPEEMEGYPTQPNPTQPNPTQKLGHDPTQKLGWAGLSKTVDNKGTSESSKTSFKTNTNDDEIALRKLRETERELTGKESPTNAWVEVFDILAAELKTAAARTEAVSSAPAFLAAHLKRRFAKPESTGFKAEKNKSSKMNVNDEPLTATPERRLTAEEIAERSQFIAELLEGGYTQEQAEAQFSRSFHADDWNLISRTLNNQNAEQGK